MDLQGKKVLVFGAGISGIGSCGLLEKEGAEVILYDGNDKKDAEAMKAQLGEGSKVRVVLGAFPEEEMESLDLVVMSPGVPTDLPVVLAMKEKGIPVWGEIYLDGEDIVYKPEKEKEGTVICKTGELQILGVHNYENVMAAVAMAAAYGVDLDVIRKSVLAFKGVEHRIEYVAEKNGVVYYNDSKGTNPDAAIKGIQAMNRPTILIGGGYDKQSDFHEWIQSFDGKVRYLVLIGATKEQIQKEAAECGFHDCILKDTFEEALDTCVELARPGDAVLLSPACASWGMFPNYEVRGEEFKKYVNAL